MAYLTSSDDTSRDIFAVRRRRLLLATAGLTLTTAVAPRLLDRAGDRAVAHHPRPASRDAAAARPVSVSAHRAPAHRAPAYPMDKPLFYIDDASRAIALTIDDGPDPEYTPQVLQLLHQYQVTATFSMIGIHVAAYPSLVRMVAAAGHQIANHTWTHPDLASSPAHFVHSELARASDAIHRVTGAQPALFRAPYGAWSATVIRQCEHMKMVPLAWSVDPRDWARPGTRSIVRNIMGNTRPGSIILEHDGGGNRAQTVAALRIVLPRLLDEGYHFRTP
jgi:peptidoglycan-N-acetylglucosamine deacetylase